MNRVTIKLLDGGDPAKILMFDAAGLSLDEFIAMACKKIGITPRKCDLYLGKTKDVIIEDLHEIQNGDLISLDFVKDRQNSKTPEKSLDTSDKWLGRHDLENPPDPEDHSHSESEDDFLSHDNSGSDSSLVSSSDEGEFESSSDGDDSDSDSWDEDDDADEDDYLEDLWGRSKKEKEKKAEKALPQVYGYMDPRDIPLAPGDPDQGDGELESHCHHVDTTGDSLANEKAKIAKMLQLGLHPNTTEAEAMQAMKRAQKLLTKFNLTQAAVLNSLSSPDRNLSNVSALNGGLCSVEVRRRLKGGSFQPAVLNTWMHSLAKAVSENFQVKYYYKSRAGKITFYGIRTNAQLSAYAFKIAIDKISIMRDKYKPPEGEYERKWRRGETVCESKSGYTLSSRLSYCEGISSGLHKFVKNNLLQQERKQVAKLTRARERLENPEAYSSRKDRRLRGDKEEDGVAEVKDGDSDDSDSDSDVGDGDSDSDAEDDIPIQLLVSRRIEKKKIKEEAARHRVEKLEEKQKTAGALVIHMEDIAKKVLEEKEIKLTKGARRAQRKEQNPDAWTKGYEDSKEIDLNQRAITNEGKSKKRKRAQITT